ncbi:transporter [Klebsiella michiganensis]|uniref:Transporter n=1 Tax=Klebsiella michiganensis TaxID=1134687 RepID=A0A6P1UT80_9ENTR|nr:transporter [Klebsiella michiganensis]MEB8291795.1 transporter [Klebsiella michiganensis]MXJ79438.1 transporter [Klebsiella michiganensis]QHS45178.1 transporter [Klebsiella michiganensis]
MTIFKSLLSFLGAASACAFVVFCLWVDIHFWDYNISELSLTEIVQELVLTTIVFIHFRLAKQYNAMRYCHILVGGFFLAMLIRELDALFDLISHGSWLWFALIAALLALIYPLIHYRQTLAQLAQYTRTPWYGLLISGLLAILVFSRLFGMQGLWHAILNDGYVRVVKNVVEEGCESFGYMLCLTASIGHYRSFRGT